VNKAWELKDIANEKEEQKKKANDKSVLTSLKSPCDQPGKLVEEGC
jgi:hypothetical protein